MEPARIKDIVTSARTGSEQAYRDLVSCYGSRLLGYFLRNIGKRADAEDLVQDVFVRVVKALKRYREKERFEVWLYRIAHNVLIDYWRKHRTLFESDMSDQSDQWVSDLQGNSDNPSSAAIQQEDRDRLQEALARLSQEQREVILLRYFSGLSFEDISNINGTPLGTSLARAHRGLSRLRELLGKDEQ